MKNKKSQLKIEKVRNLRLRKANAKLTDELNRTMSFMMKHLNLSFADIFYIVSGDTNFLEKKLKERDNKCES